MVTAMTYWRGQPFKITATYVRTSTMGCQGCGHFIDPGTKVHRIEWEGRPGAQNDTAMHILCAENHPKNIDNQPALDLDGGASGFFHGTQHDMASFVTRRHPDVICECRFDQDGPRSARYSFRVKPHQG